MIDGSNDTYTIISILISFHSTITVRLDIVSWYIRRGKEEEEWLYDRPQEEEFEEV
jgi:hypothetical protein